MSDHFLDTSAIVKHYHPEVGTPKVEPPLDQESNFRTAPNRPPRFCRLMFARYA